MKKLLWMRTMFDAYKASGKIISTIDKLVVESGAHSYGVVAGKSDTMEKFDAIINLIRKKNKLVLLRELVEGAVKFIDKKLQYVLVRYYFDQKKINEISLELNLSERTIRRMVEYGLENCFTFFQSKGYGLKKLDLEFENEGWLAGIYNGWAKKLSEKKRKKKDIVFKIAPNEVGYGKVVDSLFMQ